MTQPAHLTRFLPISALGDAVRELVGNSLVEISKWDGVDRWRIVTHHGRTEIVNAICRAAFLGELKEKRSS